jgi:hypothetical protein
VRSLGLTAWLVVWAGFTACATPDDEDAVAPSAPAFAAHGEPSDFDPVQVPPGKADSLPSTFDPAWLMADPFFTQTDAISVYLVQKFFEETPYGTRTWLADETVGSQSAAEALVQVSKTTGINPILLLARMQVEKSLISATERPKQSRVDYAFGCGCPDGRACMTAYKGLDKQLTCAGDTLRDLYAQSEAGEGQWRAGKARKTLDPEWVTPANHATAALYGYTPWVLRRRGGNWLVWNITKKFAKRFEELGVVNADDGCLNDGRRPFVGDACACPRDCDFQERGGAAGVCHEAGFCTLPCAGFCPDLAGRAPTFCAPDPSVDGQAGICVSKAIPDNGHCADVPGTIDASTERFIGNSSAPARDAEVCLPAP